MALPKQVQEELSIWGLEFRRAAEADDYRWILEQDNWDVGSMNNAEEKGQALAEATVEAIFMSVTLRSMEQGDDPRFEGWMRDFLSRQTYARPISSTDRGYMVSFGGTEHSVTFFVRSVDEIDYEDIRENILFNIIHLLPVNQELNAEDAEIFLEEIEADLNYSGEDLRLESALEGKALVIEILESEESD